MQTHDYKCQWEILSTLTTIMHPYRNLSSDSGVLAYEIGADYIKVQFEKAIYLYTYRITATGGEHYVEARTMAGLTKGEVVQLESGKQKILKLDFDKAIAIPTEAVTVADLNFELPGAVTVASWQSNNEGKKYPYPEYYFAFEKGDEIILNLTMSNKNGTNQINVSTYPYA